MTKLIWDRRVACTGPSGMNGKRRRYLLAVEGRHSGNNGICQPGGRVRWG